jgi:hypothetical protein
MGYSGFTSVPPLLPLELSFLCLRKQLQAGALGRTPFKSSVGLLWECDNLDRVYRKKAFMGN